MDPLLDRLQTGQAASAVVVLAVLLLVETAHPVVEHAVGRGRHALRNLALGVLNGALVAAVFAGLWVSAAVWAGARGWGALGLVEAPVWVHAALAVLLLDAWTYAWHRLNHAVPFLWRLHRVHHSDARMDVTTASRFHTGEIVLSALLRVPVIVLVGATAWELVLYETLMFAVVQLHHANVALPAGLEARLGRVIVTPAMHKVHHSRWQPETDSNYSALFSWWDRLFGSFRRGEGDGPAAFGLDGFDGDEHQSVGGMLRSPFGGPSE